jgi:hypothetical protein
MLRIEGYRIFAWVAAVFALAWRVQADEIVTNAAPVIVQQPAYQTVTAGGTTLFTVAAVGAQPLSYQWKKDGTNFSFNFPSIVLVPVQPSDAGVYSVVVSNSLGAVESEGARLTVLPVLDRALTIYDVRRTEDGKVGARIGIRAAGDENVVSFKLAYDTNVLSNPTAILVLENFEVESGGTSAPPVGPVVQPIIGPFLIEQRVAAEGDISQKEAKLAKGDTAQEVPRGSEMDLDTSVPGVIGVKVTLPPGRVLLAGTQQLVSFYFTPLASGPLATGLRFVEAPSALSLAGAPLAAAGTITANSVAGAMSDRANRQSGYFTQPLTVSNPSALDLPGVRVYVRDLQSDSETNVVRLANGLGTNGLPFVGVPYFDFGTIVAGSAVTFNVEFYVANRLPPKLPVYEAIVQAPTVLSLANAFVVNTNATRLTNGLFLATFKSERERQYYIQYNSSVTATNGWKTSLPGFVGSGDFVQWIDSGPPRTETHPTNTAMRFYRVLATP